MTETAGSHYCSACGEVHGGRTGKDPEVEIARINAERDIRVAEIGRSTARGVTETEAAAQVETAELEAAAAVAVAEETDPAPPEPETIPVIVDGTPAEPEPEPEPTIEPMEENLPAPETSRSAGGYWG